MRSKVVLTCDFRSQEFVGKEISGPVLNEQYIVISTYQKDGAQEVSLSVGELVDVIEKYENGWSQILHDTTDIIMIIIVMKYTIML